ncbi:MAG: AzlC family ABC transporter permease [Magnetovibrio sp.]|nr:AzlC family ABC transporter permease [Magnetovibrio sp.]
MPPRDMPRPLAAGFREALGAPALGLFAALTGYGAMTETVGMDPLVMLASVVLIWSMPALMTFSEVAAAGGGVWVMFVAVTFANLRNIPMVVTALPMVRTEGRLTWKDMALAQLLSPTTWVHILVFSETLPAPARRRYFVAFSATVLVAAVIGAVAGYAVVGELPKPVATALLFLTPVYLLLIIMSVRRLSGYLSLALGAVALPLLMDWSLEWGLALGGLGAGTAGFVLGGGLRRRAKP